LADADHEEYAPATSCLFISQLTCSLVGQTQTIHLTPGSRVCQICQAAQIVTPYFCNYGLNPAFREHLEQSELAITGMGAEDEVRVVELPPHRFFLATLFLPQWGSTAERPNSLIVAYLHHCRDFVHEM
jgi:CTP synthase (UTP-ammonia lyase)